ncbi:MAG: metallophosphoesterase [Flavobacteriales bacterium]|nr:metallophosphoesterase [Flavobacteriales bacterium]
MLRTKVIYTVFTVGILLLFGCKEQPKEAERDYSFFVAGHAYGSPTNYQGGLMDAFMAQLDTLNQDSLMKFGVFTGDLVKYSEEQYWNMLVNDLEEIKAKTYATPGNHDVINPQFFLGLFTSFYQSFYHQNDLFILLDANPGGWNIEGYQLDFLKNKVAEHDASKGNIFVFTHQLIWMDHERYKGLGVNSSEGRDSTLTFWTEIVPLFEDLSCKTYFFAGDVGAFDWATPVFHDEQDNLTFIASGMGGGVKDNYIIADVYTNKEVKFRLISLNPTVKIGKLEDY